MAYVFRIHDTNDPQATRPTAAANVNGWGQVAHIEGALLKNIVLGQQVNKAGTSIPSIFARLHLYKSAFNIMRGSNAAALRTQNINTKTISDCWDLSEFLFQHGEDDHLIVRKWDINQQINILSQSPSVGHKKLADVLKDERQDIGNVNYLYLFYWRDYPANDHQHEVETLIGGTSPFTLVYLSANWKRKAKDNGWKFTRLDGSPLFDENHPASLLERNDSFKKMVYALYNAYSNELTAYCPDFTAYLNTCWLADQAAFNDLNQKYGLNTLNFLSDYPCIVDDIGGVIGIPTTNMSIPISYSRIDVTDSDYMMIPSVAMNPANTPLVLNQSGLPGAKYIGDAIWETGRCSINEAYIKTTNVAQRVLPGGQGIKHPFVSVSDFIEDKIFKAPRTIDSSRFVTCNVGQTNYLLPLKPKFFEYFTIEDIVNHRQVAVSGGQTKYLVELQHQNNSVSVILNIPVQANNGQGFVELKKTYLTTEIINLSTNFTIGIHPFYTVDNNPGMNEYSFLLSGNNLSLSFYNVQGGIIRNINAIKSDSPRTTSRPPFEETNYYNIHAQSFNCVGLTYFAPNGSGRAMIIPLLRKVQSNNPTRFTFAVDFGTSNTHIAYYDSANTTPRTFSFDSHDQQTVFLQENQGPMSPFFEREFAPVSIGQSSKYAQYPTRTAVCEKANFAGNLNLFGNISAGYTIDSEKTEVDQKFNTDLKWALEVKPGDATYTSRVRAYFKQILWMLKNKVLLNDGDSSFDVLLTFPAAMTITTRNTYIGIWNQVKQDLLIPNCNIVYTQNTSESVAPYYDLINQVVGGSFLNVDIGGGTSDFLFVIKDAAGHITQSRYSSIMFAADDLWGDGQQTLASANKDNGFCKFVQNSIISQAGAFPQSLMSQLNVVTRIMPKSSDIMSFFFKHDSAFNVTSIIKGNSDLYTLIFIHYASIMYYVSKAINRLNIEIPNHISLTGLGSKYVNIISPVADDVKEFTKLLLENFTGKKCPAVFAIHMSDDRKEITARGALRSTQLIQGSLAIDNLEQIIEHGFDVNKELTYGDVTSETIRDKVMSTFESFMSALREPWFKNYLNKNFAIVLSDDLLSDFENLGASSYQNICACIPAAKFNVDMNESLFFWPLKNVFYEMSKKIVSNQVTKNQ